MKIKKEWTTGYYEERSRAFLRSIVDEDGECQDHDKDSPEECYGCIAAVILKLPSHTTKRAK